MGFSRFSLFPRFSFCKEGFGRVKHSEVVSVLKFGVFFIEFGNFVVCFFFFWGKGHFIFFVFDLAVKVG